MGEADLGEKVRYLVLVSVLLVLAVQSAQAAHSHKARPGVRVYARKLVLHRWHSIWQWQAEDQLVRNESGWDPCAYYPSSHDCHYRGSNACGIPQRDRYPKPCAWAGDLWNTRYEQVRWMERYIASKWGTPQNALRHEEHGGY